MLLYQNIISNKINKTDGEFIPPAPYTTPPPRRSLFSLIIINPNNIIRLFQSTNNLFSFPIYVALVFVRRIHRESSASNIILVRGEFSFVWQETRRRIRYSSQFIVYQ